MSKTCSFSRVIDGQRYYCGNLTKEGEDFCWRHKSDYKTPLERCRKEIEELKQENTKLVELLLLYGYHNPGCNGMYPPYKCKCGWTAVKEEFDTSNRFNRRII